MATWTSFRDIVAWRRARELDALINPLVIRLKQQKHFGLSDQISRSSGSVMDNIAEGYGRGGNKEFKQFLYYSMGSIHELESQIIRCLDRKIIDKAEYEHLINNIKETMRVIGGLAKHLKQTDYKGIKFKI